MIENRTLLGTRRGLAIEPSSIAALEACPNIHDILAAYAAESAIDGLPPPIAQVEIYRALEAAGALHVVAARFDGDLIGYITVLINGLPHYGINIALCESFFVRKEHRKTGAGLRLLRAAEDKARAFNAPGLLVSAPFEGDLFRVLPRVGYRESHRVFFKQVSA